MPSSRLVAQTGCEGAARSSSLMAAGGQPVTHKPQPMHRSVLTTATLSRISMALTGQRSSAQMPQPLQSSALTLAR